MALPEGRQHKIAYSRLATFCWDSPESTFPSQNTLYSCQLLTLDILGKNAYIRSPHLSPLPICLLTHSLTSSAALYLFVYMLALANFTSDQTLLSPHADVITDQSDSVAEFSKSSYRIWLVSRSWILITCARPSLAFLSLLSQLPASKRV